MVVPVEQQYVSVQEAAEILGVHRERVGRLLREGVLTWKPNALDRRQRLIPRHEVEQLRDTGNRPAPRHRKSTAEDAGNGLSAPGGTAKPAPESGAASVARPPRPRSIGMVSDGSLPARDSEAWLKEHWGKR
jgi:excisionase family DNA binding protein